MNVSFRMPNPPLSGHPKFHAQLSAREGSLPGSIAWRRARPIVTVLQPSAALQQTVNTITSAIPGVCPAETRAACELFAWARTTSSPAPAEWAARA